MTPVGHVCYGCVVVTGSSRGGENNQESLILMKISSLSTKAGLNMF